MSESTLPPIVIRDVSLCSIARIAYPTLRVIPTRKEKKDWRRVCYSTNLFECFGFVVFPRELLIHVSFDRLHFRCCIVRWTVMVEIDCGAATSTNQLVRLRWN